jgi:hypothetical protein
MMRARERVALVARVTKRARKRVAFARVTKRAREIQLRVMMKTGQQGRV